MWVERGLSVMGALVRVARTSTVEATLHNPARVLAWLLLGPNVPQPVNGYSRAETCMESRVSRVAMVRVSTVSTLKC